MTQNYQDRIHIEKKGGVEQVTRPYREGFAAQKLGKRWGFIDESGHLAIKRRFDYCHDFCNGIAAVKIGDKWGFIDRQGTVIHEPYFDDAKSFQGDFAEVKLRNEWKLLSRSGELGEAISTNANPAQQATGGGGVAIQQNRSKVPTAGRAEYPKMKGGVWYWVGYWISFVLIFVGCWVYCIASYGFLLGVGLGWLPSGIAAGILSFLWPLILSGIAIIIVILILASH